MSDSYVIKLKSSETIADGTRAFRFDKPPGFQFKAGQAVDIGLIDLPETDGAGNTRAFSLTSAPFESELAIATRMRSTAFKRVLGALVPGNRVRLEGPFGSLTLHRDVSRPAVFLAGGIGITPFLSMIKQVCHEGASRRLLLFYSNNRPEDTAFLDQLLTLERRHPFFRLVCTMTDMAKSSRPWTGETRRLEFTMVKAELMEQDRPVYYSAGPPAMVTAMRTMLNAAGVEDDDIRAEDFAGY
jgi:ferredoxin-NADP reductase